MKQKLLAAAFAGLACGHLLAQDIDVEVSSVSGNPGATVEVEISFFGNGDARNIDMDLQVSDLTAFTSTDASNCDTNVDADLGSCQLRAAPDDDTLRYGFINAADPMETCDPCGTWSFTIDPGATPGDTFTIDLVQSNFENDPTVNFTQGVITVVDASAVLNVDPTSIPFGNQQTGTTSAAQAVTVSNDGTDGIDLELTGFTFSGPFADAGTGDCSIGTTLADGENCTVDVEFSPVADGAAMGDLVVASDAGATTADTVDFTGTGTPGPIAAFTINPNVAAFGTVDLGDMPQSIVHTIENTGDAGSTLELNSLAYTGDAEFSVTDNTCPASLGATESCTVTVTFDAAADGMYTGDVDVSTNVGDFNVPVSGEAASVAVLSINPPFGPVDLGDGLAGETITANGAITNDGSAPGDFSCVLGGADAGVFSTNPSPLSGVVPAGDDVGFSLSCNLPTSSMDGDTFNATLTCTSDDDDTFGGVHSLSCGTQNIPMIPVPTMQPWALVLFSMLMLIAGGIGIRFFRAS